MTENSDGPSAEVASGDFVYLSISEKSINRRSEDETPVQDYDRTVLRDAHPVLVGAGRVPKRFEEELYGRGIGDGGRIEFQYEDGTWTAVPVTTIEDVVPEKISQLFLTVGIETAWDFIGESPDELADELLLDIEQLHRLQAETERVLADRRLIEYQISDIYRWTEREADGTPVPTDSRSSSEPPVERSESHGQSPPENSSGDQGTPHEDRQELSPEEALSETTLLVDYHSKVAPVVAQSTFDPDEVVVSGEAFNSYITETQAYRFLRWLVGEFPSKIQESKNISQLKLLFDALPELGRAELDATVALEGSDRETAQFDIVGRNHRGDPLFVAHLEDSRAPTTDETLESLITDATAATESQESIVGAFAVTSRYFGPEALEAARRATGQGVFSYNKRKALVTTSQRGGYHLCLVEDREKSFYLSMPELL